MVSKLRAQRVADRIREKLSEMVLMDISDPRITGVSITDVEVDRELTFADIYVSALEGSDRADEILEGFLHARGYIRHELATYIDLRTFPRLRFHWDPTFERADRIDQLIASLHEEDQLVEPGDSNASPDQEQGNDAS